MLVTLLNFLMTIRDLCLLVATWMAKESWSEGQKGKYYQATKDIGYDPHQRFFFGLFRTWQNFWIVFVGAWKLGFGFYYALFGFYKS